MRPSLISVLLAGAFAILSAAQASDIPSEPKPWNVMIAPVGILSDVYGLDLDAPIGDSWSLGPTLAYTHGQTFRTVTQAWEVGASLRYFLSHHQDVSGFYLRVSAYLAPIQLRSRSANVHYFAMDLMTGGLFGYRWVLPHCFNLNLASGIAFYKTDSDSLADSPATGEPSYQSKTGAQPILELSLGWFF